MLGLADVEPPTTVRTILFLSTVWIVRQDDRLPTSEYPPIRNSGQHERDPL